MGAGYNFRYNPVLAGYTIDMILVEHGSSDQSVALKNGHKYRKSLKREAHLYREAGRQKRSTLVPLNVAAEEIEDEQYTL